MTIKIFSKGSTRARDDNTVRAMRLHARVPRARRAVTTIEGLLFVFALLAVLSIYIAHNPTEATSFHQIAGQITGFINYLRALPGEMRNLYNSASNAGNQFRQIGQ